MTDPRGALTDAIYDALNTASLTALMSPNEEDSLPYTKMDGGLIVDGGGLTTKSSEGAEIVFGLTSYATNETDAMTNASTGLDALTDRTAPLSVTGYTTARCDVDTSLPPARDIVNDLEYWGIHYSVRFTLKQN